MDQYIGKLLDGRYEMLEVIGSGGMAVVYKARCNRLNRLVAVKVLKEELSQDTEFRRRFHAESQAVAMLSHPNIMGVYDVSHSENLDYIVMELIEGITLKQYLEQKGTLNWREALHFATQIARALDHAHSRGIIHRDIKPHNIMLLKDGSVKVADFGIARVTSAQNTLTREALGSVHYISPEQAKGAHVDCRSDLYSLGVVMYEMLTGQPPFDGDTPVSVAIQHINATPKRPRELNPSIPEGLEQITMHAMSAELPTRYHTAAQMVSDLENFRKNPNVIFDFTEDNDEFDPQRFLDDPDYDLDGPAAGAAAAHSRMSVPARKVQQKPASAPPVSKRGSRIAFIAGVVCILLIICGLGYLLYSYFLSDLFATTQEVPVPELVGKAYDSLDLSQYPDLHFEVSEWRKDELAEYGFVIEQSPNGGQQVKVGTDVTLVLSLGSQSSTMPALVNLTIEEAEKTLKAMDLDVQIKVLYQPSDEYADGHVIDTIPAYQGRINVGEQVTLVVSLGAAVEFRQVPSLVGKDVEAALQEITEAGLAKGPCTYRDDDAPKGTVIYQSIEPGESVKEGTVINLQVSNGPVQAEQPIVKYLSKSAEVKPDEPLELLVRASCTDGGTLTYAWYVSTDGSYDGAKVVLYSAVDQTSCKVDTSVPGTYYYFCKIINTLEKSSASVNTDMIQVTVLEPPKPTEYRLSISRPAEGDKWLFDVKIDGQDVYEPFELTAAAFENGNVQILLTGMGKQQADVYVDGVLVQSELIDFDAAGQ